LSRTKRAAAFTSMLWLLLDPVVATPPAWAYCTPPTPGAKFTFGCAAVSARPGTAAHTSALAVQSINVCRNERAEYFI
jgi:hypothetical protein